MQHLTCCFSVYYAEHTSQKGREGVWIRSCHPAPFWHQRPHPRWYAAFKSGADSLPWHYSCRKHFLTRAGWKNQKFLVHGRSCFLAISPDQKLPWPRSCSVRWMPLSAGRGKNVLMQRAAAGEPLHEATPASGSRCGGSPPATSMEGASCSDTSPRPRPRLRPLRGAWVTIPPCLLGCHFSQGSTD